MSDVPIHHDDLESIVSVSFPGPFVHHDVVVNGWRVPFLQARMNEDESVTLTLDRRIGVTLSPAEAENVIPFIADAVSVALGYGSHPRRETATPLENAGYPRPERVVDVNLGA